MYRLLKLRTGATNGGMEAEALSAAEVARRLLERYALSMDELEIRSSRCVRSEVILGSKRYRRLLPVHRPLL
jgi:hypothetical protein